MSSNRFTNRFDNNSSSEIQDEIDQIQDNINTFLINPPIEYIEYEARTGLYFDKLTIE